MRKKVVVDIIVPVFNGEKYLEECLNSIIDQSYQNIGNVIVVDDGSNDSTNNIISKYVGNGVKIIKHSFSMGVSKSRNDGIRASSADYVTFIDSDDIVSHWYIEALVEQLDKDVLPTIGLSHKFNLIKKVNKTNIKNFKCLSYKQSIKEILGFGSIQGFSCGKLFNLHEIKENKIFFDQGLKICEDLEFVLRYVGITKKVVSINEGLFYYYRVHDNSALNSRGKKSKVESKIVNEIDAYNKMEKNCYFEFSKRLIQTKKLWVMNNSFYYLKRLHVGQKVIKNMRNDFYQLLKRRFIYLAFSDFIKLKPKVSFLLRLAYNVIFVRSGVIQ